MLSFHESKENISNAIDIFDDGELINLDERSKLLQICNDNIMFLSNAISDNKKEIYNDPSDLSEY